jgi:1-acyl-sn-glycerol-3-phosphate acyltransferase
VSQVDSFLAGNGPVWMFTYRVVRFLVAVITRTYTRMRIEGRHHIPATGAFVLAPVHRSYVDTPIAACLTPRRMRFMGKDTLWKSRALGSFISALGAFPVTRNTADREAFRRGIFVLESGEPLVLFPEGERKSGPVVQPLYDGAVYMAMKARVPIIPVGIGGSERVMPKGAKFVYPRRVHVIVGPPIEPPVLEGDRIPRSLVKQQSEQLHAELQRLFDEAQRAAGC